MFVLLLVDNKELSHWTWGIAALWINDFSLWLARGRHHSGTDDKGNEGSAIQEKCYAPRFMQIPQDLTVEEGRFCRIDFKVKRSLSHTHRLTLMSSPFQGYYQGQKTHLYKLHKVKGFKTQVPKNWWSGVLLHWHQSLKRVPFEIKNIQYLRKFGLTYVLQHAHISQGLLSLWNFLVRLGWMAAKFNKSN